MADCGICSVYGHFVDQQGRRVYAVVPAYNADSGGQAERQKEKVALRGIDGGSRHIGISFQHVKLCLVCSQPYRGADGRVLFVIGRVRDGGIVGRSDEFYPFVSADTARVRGRFFGDDARHAA